MLERQHWVLAADQTRCAGEVPQRDYGGAWAGLERLHQITDAFGRHAKV
jgi:hypothetical protein